MQGKKKNLSNRSKRSSSHRQERQAFQIKMVEETQSYFTTLGLDASNIDWLIEDLETL